jgi:hypothetical protein
MRSVRVSAAVLAAVLLVPAPVAVAEQAKTVEYGGVRISVPAGWPVYDLDRDPGRCVRYDRPAVFLGAGGPDQRCPAHVAGRVETVQIAPAPPDAAQRRRAVPFARIQVAETVDRQVEVAVPAAGMAVTGTYGEDRALLERVLRTMAVGPVPPTPPQAGPLPDEPDVPELRLAAGWASGKGFDSCQAPSIHTMRAWRPAYNVANIYIGGAARGCGQPNLSARWVRQARRLGYRLIPTYVGPQAPCSKLHTRFRKHDAAAQGRASADDAVYRAGRLGIPAHSPIYFDMENYSSRRAGCRNAVLTFLDAWSRRLRDHGYVSGVYSSASSGIRDLGRAGGITKPKVIWFAHWDGKASVRTSSYLASAWWMPHRRIKQYRGDHREKHGGVTLNVDSNAVDSSVY